MPQPKVLHRSGSTNHSRTHGYFAGTSLRGERTLQNSKGTQCGFGAAEPWHHRLAYIASEKMTTAITGAAPSAIPSGP